MFGLSGAELFIIGLVIVLLFGVGRLTKIGAELGSGLKSFRNAIKDDEPEQIEDKKQAPAADHKTTSESTQNQNVPR